MPGSSSITKILAINTTSVASKTTRTMASEASCEVTHGDPRPWACSH
jgi:hypothetical protein